MPKRRDFTAEDVPLVGGALALDFMNTTGSRQSETPRERFHTYSDLLTWLRRVGLLEEAAAEDFKAASEGEAAAPHQALQRALKLREDLYAVLRPLAVHDLPSTEAVAQLDLWFRQACKRRRLELRQDGVAWEWNVNPDELDSVMWPILESAGEVLASGMRALKKCGECDWLFLDETKNSSRQWCKKLCADRVRSRRYYQRSKSQE